LSIRSSQEDFLLRELRKVAAMVARALGFRAEGDLPAARAEIDEAYSTLLGPQSDLLRMLDPQSAARLIGNSKKVAALARLTAADAMLAGDADNQQTRKQLYDRARTLATEAVKLDPVDENAKAVIDELRGQ